MTYSFAVSFLIFKATALSMSLLKNQFRIGTHLGEIEFWLSDQMHSMGKKTIA